jgi:hypothetical protein
MWKNSCSSAFGLAANQACRFHFGVIIGSILANWGAVVCNLVQAQDSIPAFALSHAFGHVMSIEGCEGEERLQSDLKALQYSLPGC